MINCSDNSYYIYYTDTSSGAIAIPIAKSALDQTTLDITLVGKTRLEYGEIFNANILHLVENFASFEDSGTPNTPDLNATYLNLLYNPVIGQLWYNKTNKRLFVCTAIRVTTPIAADPVWEGITSFGDIASNSGVLFHGEVIPLPVSRDGYTFTQSECVWHVAPLNVNNSLTITGLDVSVNSNRLVTSVYTTASSTVNGSVNYFIFGIKGKFHPTYGVA